MSDDGRRDSKVVVQICVNQKPSCFVFLFEEVKKSVHRNIGVPKTIDGFEVILYFTCDRLLLQNEARKEFEQSGIH